MKVEMSSLNIVLWIISLCIWSFTIISYGWQDCGSPPDGKNAIITFTNSSLGTLVGQQAVYRCLSGHFYDWGETVVLCNETGLWVVIAGPDENSTDDWFDCSSRSTYIGCMEINSTSPDPDKPAPVFQETDFLERNNRKQCQEYCRQKGLPFVARQGFNCTCLTSIAMAATKDDMLCSGPCADVTSFCGAQGIKLYSVFSSVEECVTVLPQLNHTLTSMYTQLTCQEYCRGQNSLLSFWRGGLKYCDCLDEVPDVIEVGKGDCEAAESEEEPEETSTGRLFVTESLEPVTASSCKELFDQRIFVHGYYYLSSGSKTYCNFYDGSTTCVRGWLSYSGSCYSFLSELANANTQFLTCSVSASMLASVADQAEWDFLTLAVRNLEYMGQIAVYIGLYDTQKTFSYMWSDETPVTLRKFSSGYPLNVDNRCVVLANGVMLNVHCTSTYGAVCKKSPAMIGCVSVGAIGQPALVSSQLTTPMCFETCRANRKIYSLTKQESCYCMNDTGAWIGEPVEWSICNQRCPGNDYQICGANVTSHFFITEDVGQPYRQDCRDMVLGSVLSRAMIQNHTTGEVKVVDCNVVAGGNCSDSWLEINNRCYRFFPERAASPSAMCNSIGGYTAVYETAQEADLVQQTILSTPTLSDGNWLFGLFRHRLTGSKVRTSNGAFISDRLRTKVTSLGGYCLAHKGADVWNISTVACGSTPYICEKGSDYLGCYNQPQTVKRVVYLYRDNTPLQCKELCKGQGSTYVAVEGFAACYCVEESDLTKAASDALCTKTCAVGQMCGDASLTTVYRLDYNQTARSCEELFEQGVMLSGRYLLSSGLTWCGMKDSNYLKAQVQLCDAGDADCDLDFRRAVWTYIGTGDLDLAMDTKYWTEADSIPTRCDGVYSPATILSPANSEEAVGLITEFLAWTLDYPTIRGAYIGLVDQFTMGIYSYSDGSIFRMDRVFPNASASGLFTSFLTYPSTYRHAQIIENGVVQLISSSSDAQHVACQRDTAFQGCYVTTDPANLRPAISGYQSMTLTMCRQVCQGQSSMTLFISSTECICTDVTHLLTQAANNDTGCLQACPGSKLQHCGATNYFRMYTFDNMDVAESCQELYDNFVLLPSAYFINGTFTDCGVDDMSTSCPAGYVATSGQCYRPNPRLDIVGTTAHAQACASQGGFLASPTSESQLENLTSLLKTFTAFKDLNLWMLGYWSIFATSSYITARGHMIPKDSNITSHLQFIDGRRCIALNKMTGLTETVSCATPLPFVCEADSVKQTCVLYNKTAEEIETSLRLDNAMTVQQCVTYCQGSSPLHHLALLSGGLCVCELTNQSLAYSASSDVTCDVVCPGNALQLCGSSQSGYFSVYDIDSYSPSDLQYSCDDLLTYAIVHPGSYLTPKDYFSCFKFSEKSTFVLDLQTTAQPHPQAQMELSRLQLNGITFSDLFSEVEFALDSFYVIEGIVTTGNFSAIGVLTSLNGEVYEAQPENQNLAFSRVSGVGSWLVLPVPVVAKKIKLALTISGGVSQNASFELIGYDYKIHNFSDHFLGCFDSPMVSQGSPFPADPDFNFCLDQCYTSRNRSVLLRASPYGGSPECQCVELLESRDPYSPITRDRKCNASCSHGLVCSSSDAQDLAVYRKFDLTCDFEASPHQNHTTVLPEGVSIDGSDDNTFPVGTQLTLTCDLGYEFNLTGLESVISMCSGFDVWGLSNVDISCHAVDCGPFPAISGATVISGDSTVYNSTVQYACADVKEGFNRTEDLWEMTCQHTKEWRPQTEGCQLKLCHGSLPTVALATSNATSVTLPTVGLVILYECEEGTRFLSDNSTQTMSECKLPGLWTAVEPTCTRYQCASLPPTKDNTTLVSSSVDLQAIYQCDGGLTFSDRNTVKHVSCNATTLEWDILEDECKIHKFFEAQVCLVHTDQRVSQTSVIGHYTARGTVDCVQTCMFNTACVTLSFSTLLTFGETNCILTNDTASNTTTIAQRGWNVYSLNGDC